MVATSLWLWAGFVGFVLVMLVLDLGVFNRQPHEIAVREATLFTAMWVALAGLFAAGLALFRGVDAALTFLTGYLVEESLSADNIFVMVLIFGYFAVPRASQHRVLFYGILGALVMRGLFIGIGSLLLARVDWILYVFGAMLVIAAVRMALEQDARFEAESNPVVKLFRRFVPLTGEFDRSRFVVRRLGRRMATPLLLVLVVVEVTDLLFAVDSIPAVFGITRDPFLVFTSNIFAVFGLRSLYFLLAAVIDRFHLLKYGLAAILAFVGVKMLGSAIIHIGTLPSLAFILVVLVLCVTTSLAWPRPASRKPPAGPGRGAVGDGASPTTTDGAAP